MQDTICFEVAQDVIGFNLFEVTMALGQAFQPLGPDRRRFGPSGVEEGFNELWVPAEMRFMDSQIQSLQEILIHWRFQVINPESMFEDPRYRIMSPFLNENEINNADIPTLRYDDFAYGLSAWVERRFQAQFDYVYDAQGQQITFNITLKFIVERDGYNLVYDIPIVFTALPNGGYQNCITYNPRNASGPAGSSLTVGRWLRAKINSGFELLSAEQGPFQHNSPFAAIYENNAGRLYGIRIQMLFADPNAVYVACDMKSTQPVKFKEFSERYEIWNVPSRNNNCLFSVIRYGMGSDYAKSMHGRVFARKMRDTLGLLPNTPVLTSVCAQISILLKVRIELYNCLSVTPYQSYDPTYDDQFTIENVRCIRVFVEDGHAMWIREKDMRTCPICLEEFDGRGFANHQKRCVSKGSVLQWKCCDCGSLINIPKTEFIQKSEDITFDVIRQFHLCNQRQMSFYQRMIVSKAQQKRGEPAERYVIPMFVPEDLAVVDLNDDDLIQKIGKHTVEEMLPVGPEDDASSVQTSSTSSRFSKKRKASPEVYWRYLCEEKLYAIDIETFADPERNSSFTPYAVGTWFSERPVGQEYVEFFGPDCMTQLTDDLFYWKKETGIRTLLTYNGRGFDFNFILRALLDGFFRHGKKINIQHLTPQGSNIMGFQWGRTRSFDLYSFFLTSLAKVCSDFKIDQSLQKASFPHAFVRSFDDLDYVGPIPDACYWPEPDKIPKFESRYDYLQGGDDVLAERIWREENRFCLREFSSFYLRKDVLGMVEVYKIFSYEVYNRLRLNLCFYLTAPALAYSMFRMNMGDFYIPLPRDESMQSFFQSAVYGGRVYPRRLGYESAAYDVYDEVLKEVEENPFQSIFWKNDNVFDEVEHRIQERYDESFVEALQQDYICDMDVVSLYPTAMMSFFPCGKMYIATQNELDVLNLMTANPVSLIQAWDLTPYEAMITDENPTPFFHLDIGHGIFKVDITPNCSLLEPVLPRADEKRGTVWDLNNIEGGVYTTVDLCRALQKGYTITKFHSGISFQGIAPILRNHILRAKAYKDEGDKDPVGKAAIRTFGKLILNSTYGKFLQKPRFSSTQFVMQDELCTHLIKNGTWDNILPVHSNGCYLVSTTKIDPKMRMEEINKPTYLGAFVLSLSRRIMDKIYHTADPCGNCLANLPYYGDTDSLLLHARTLSRLDKAGLVADPKNKQFGQVCNENGDARIIRGFFIAPKLYCFEYVTNKQGHYRGFHIRAKGVPSSDMRFNQYEKMDEQRWDIVTKTIEKCDPDLVRVPFQSFLRTGTKLRIRQFKEGELVALQEREKMQKEQEEEYLLHQLLTLQTLDEQLELDKTDISNPAPVPLFVPQKTRIEPFNVVLTCTKRSISSTIYSARDYLLSHNLLLPKNFDPSHSFSRSCELIQTPWIDGYLAKKQTKYANYLH